jgi:outer membrane immunogenic protein
LKKILSLCVALTAFAIAPSANAADMPVRGPMYKYAPPPAPVFNWSGFYIGAHAGYGFGDFLGNDIDGFAGGLQVGYNWQFSPNLVFGIEGDFTASDINGLAFAPGFPYHIDYLGTVRGRLGYTWDRTMFYGTGGVAFERASLGGIHGRDTGYVLGAGLEWAFSQGWSARAEYLYYGFENNIELSMVRLGMNYRFNTGW